jgi:hypothetical protein
VVLLGAQAAQAQQEPVGDDPIAIPGQQNLTLGSGARAFGMGGAFLARADDATAASWNPAGLSYLRAPELSLVVVYNSFTTVDNLDNDSLKGSSVDFAAFTGRGAGEVTRNASPQQPSVRPTREGPRGHRRRDDTDWVGAPTTVTMAADGRLATFRLSRHVRAGSL